MGAREHSGRAKTGYYKGIYCGSTYELAWVIHQLDCGISFERNASGFQYTYENASHCYYPDFVVSGSFVEIKGYSTEKDDHKWKDFPHLLEVLYKPQLTEIIEYVSSTYGVPKDKLYKLYDGYRPQYEYSCQNCEVVYLSDRRKKSVNTFCSNVCAGKFRQKMREINNR